MSLKQQLLNIISSSPNSTSRERDFAIVSILADDVESLQIQVDGLTTDTINVVPTFADLPDPVVAGLNALAVVKTTTGILFINRRRKGLYVSDGAAWQFVAEFDANQIAYDDTATSLGVENVQEAIEAVYDITIDKADLIHTHVAADITDFTTATQAIIDTQPTGSLTWGFLKDQWDTAPTLNKTITGGSVYNYTYNSVLRYRFVPSVYDPTTDAFYNNFNDMTDTLTGLIVARGL